MSATKQEAAYRIRATMDFIEAAQNHLSSAHARISSVAGAGKEWTKIGRIYDELHCEWFRLEKLLNSGKCDLDADAKVSFKAKGKVKS